MKHSNSDPNRAPTETKPPIDYPIDYNDNFELFDLKVEVDHDKSRPMICNHPVGSYFLVSGENMKIPDGMTFPIYPLAAILPLLPAKQRKTHPNDWITTDSIIACPDPNCGGIFLIKRLALRTFYHHQTTATVLKTKHGQTQAE